MHGKSYHIEVNHWHLKRAIDAIYDCQGSLEEMAESRKLLVKHDQFLTCMSHQLFESIDRLDNYLKGLIEEYEKSTAVDTSEEIADNLEKHINGTLSLKSSSEDEQ